MNNVQVFTKDISIMVRLAGYDFNRLEDFDVTIEAGPENRMRVIHVPIFAADRQFIEQDGFLTIRYSGQHTFVLDDLKVTCKYPVTVKCDNFTIGKFIYPKVKTHLPKEELESKTKEELQEKLNKFIEAGFLPPDTTTDDIEL